MKNCLVTPSHTEETNAHRKNIAFKANEIHLKDLPLGQRTYETPQLASNVHTSAHSVGQMQNNLYKLKRVLEKTGMAESMNQLKIAEGDPSAVLKCIHHLMFRASETFTDAIQTGLPKGMNAHKDIKFQPDQIFYKSVSLILCDLFGYRVELTPAQFFEQGFAERKIILVLSIYDILKQVRKGIKINNKLTRVEAGAPHASDETMKQYMVVDHKAQVTKNMMFQINPQMQRR